ncbi:MAG: hypothetical protein WDM77_01775 [Steroidobacteraceae bacterium]
MALIIGVWRRPTVGIAAVLCLYGLKQWGQSSSGFFAEHREFTNFAVFFIALFGVVRAAQQRSCVFCRLPTTAVLVLALYAYALMSLTWTPDIEAALGQWLALGPYVITIALLAPLLFSDFDGAKNAFTWTALVATVICALALWFGTWGSRGLVIFGHDASGDNFLDFETNPLAMSSMAGTVVVIAALWFARPNRPSLRAIAAVCILIGVAVILRTGSRGQLIATGAAVVVALPIAYRLAEARSIAAFAFAVVLVAGLGWWATSLVHFDASRWESARSLEDVTGRIDNAQLLLRASTANLHGMVFGLGNSSAFKILGIYPHITGLEVIAEEGIIGAAMYFGILALAVRSIWRIAHRADFDDLKRNVLAMLTGLLVFELIISWKQGSLLISVYVFAYAIALARLETPIGAVKHAVAPMLSPIHSVLPRFQNLMR